MARRQQGQLALHVLRWRLPVDPKSAARPSENQTTQNHGLKKWLKKWLVTWMRKLLGLKEQHAVEVKTTVWGPHGEQQSQLYTIIIYDIQYIIYYIL